MTSRQLAALPLLVLLAGRSGEARQQAQQFRQAWQAPPEGGASAATTYRNQAIKTTNAERTKRDRVALRKHACLQRKAASHAKRMAKQQRIFHQDLGKVLRDCGMSLVGENVASGYPTGVAVVNRG